MNRLLCFITTACIAAVIILAGNSTVGASDTQALDPAKSTSQNVAKSGSTAKVNVDSQGVIIKGYDVVADFKRIKVQHTYLPPLWTKPILTKIPQSMRRAMAHFVPTA